MTPNECVKSGGGFGGGGGRRGRHISSYIQPETSLLSHFFLTFLMSLSTLAHRQREKKITSRIKYL